MAKQDRSDPDAGRTALLYQLLETEMGGVQVYRTALQCARNPELRTAWTRFLAQTERHVVVARDLLQRLGLDPDAEPAARVLVRHDGEALVKAMHEALAVATPAEAELVAVECVVKAETKDHLNWSLLGQLAEDGAGTSGELMRAAQAQVEAEEDEHIAHGNRWARALWAQAIGVPATEEVS